MYLGREVGSGKVRPMSAKVEDIKKFLQPVTKTDMRAFLGLTGYYRRFVHRYAEIAAPLTDTLTGVKPDKIVWTEKELQAFEQLKEVLAKEPVLQGPNYTKQFFLQTDASDRGISAVLSQKKKTAQTTPSHSSPRS